MAKNNGNRFLCFRCSRGRKAASADKPATGNYSSTEPSRVLERVHEPTATKPLHEPSSEAVPHSLEEAVNRSVVSFDAPQIETSKIESLKSDDLDSVVKEQRVESPVQRETEQSVVGILEKKSDLSLTASIDKPPASSDNIVESISIPTAGELKDAEVSSKDSIGVCGPGVKAVVAPESVPLSESASVIEPVSKSESIIEPLSKTESVIEQLSKSKQPSADESRDAAVKEQAKADVVGGDKQTEKKTEVVEAEIEPVYDPIVEFRNRFSALFKLEISGSKAECEELYTEILEDTKSNNLDVAHDKLIKLMYKLRDIAEDVKLDVLVLLSERHHDEIIDDMSIANFLQYWDVSGIEIGQMVSTLSLASRQHSFLGRHRKSSSFTSIHDEHTEEIRKSHSHVNSFFRAIKRKISFSPKRGEVRANESLVFSPPRIWPHSKEITSELGSQPDAALSRQKSKIRRLFRRRKPLNESDSMQGLKCLMTEGATLIRHDVIQHDAWLMGDLPVIMYGTAGDGSTPEEITDAIVSEHFRLPVTFDIRFRLWDARSLSELFSDFQNNMNSNLKLTSDDMCVVSDWFWLIHFLRDVVNQTEIHRLRFEYVLLSISQSVLQKPILKEKGSGYTNNPIYEACWKFISEGRCVARSSGLIKADLIDVLSMFYVAESHSKWIPYLKQARCLWSYGQYFKLILHESSMPWPLNDKETLFFAFGTNRIRDNGSVCFVSASVPSGHITSVFGLPSPLEKKSRLAILHSTCSLRLLKDKPGYVQFDVCLLLNLSVRFIPTGVQNWLVKISLKQFYETIQSQLDKLASDSKEIIKQSQEELYYEILNDCENFYNS